MTEHDDAVSLANRVLDKPHIDPDGDICMLARQLLRGQEQIERLMREIAEIHHEWMLCKEHRQSNLQNLKRVEAEIDQLRALLRRVEDDSANWLALDLQRDIREALGPAPVNAEHIRLVMHGDDFPPEET